MWIFVLGGFVPCLLALRPVQSPCSAISRSSPITYSLALNISLFVPRYIFRVFYLGSRHAKSVSIRLVSTPKPSVQMDNSPGRSVSLLAFFAPFSLSLAKRAMLPRKVSGSNYSVCFVSVAASRLVPSAMVYTRRYPSVSFFLLMDLDQS